MEALMKMSSPVGRAMRHHEIEFVQTREIVPGDIIYLEEGVSVWDVPDAAICPTKSFRSGTFF
jgi:magnesium-transporting ATPase (P-type)